MHAAKVVHWFHETERSTDHLLPCRLPELAIPLLMFEKKGYQVHIASIAGGKVPIDPLSTSALTSRLGPMRRFLGSREPPRSALQ